MTLQDIIARLQEIVDDCDEDFEGDTKRAIERLKLDVEIAQRRASDAR
jgi:uncharacterized protein (DUF2461 family)